jgi:hypothetical protein
MINNMSVLTPKALAISIKKYKASHPRSTIINFEGEPQEYEIEQPGWILLRL